VLDGILIDSILHGGHGGDAGRDGDSGDSDRDSD